MRRFLLPLARRAGDATLMARALVRRDADLTVPPVVTRPAEPLLVLAPHPDDEAIGCGGTLALAEEAAVLFLTGDGVRREEAAAAAEALGLSRIEFLGVAENRLRADDETAARVRTHVEAAAPRTLLVPYPLDRHRDHAVAARLAALALAGDDLAVWCYEVWSPLDPNRLVDVTSVTDRKRAAIRCHASQTADLHYEDATLGLNRYRALLAPGAAYAEGFLECTTAELGRLTGLR